MNFVSAYRMPPRFYAADSAVFLWVLAQRLRDGCSIGNGLVETAFFSWQGWVSLPLMIIGTWVAAYFTIIRPQRLKLAKSIIRSLYDR